MLDWVLEKLPVLIFVVVFIAQVARGFMRTKQGQTDAEPQARPNELEEHRRTQEVQEEIRRRIAERRSGRAAPPSPASEPAPPVVTEPDPTAIPPLPEPLRRMLEQLEKRAEPVPPPPLAEQPQMVAQRNAELERQERLAAEMKSLEEARAAAARRAAQLAAAKADEARSQGALLTASRTRLDDDLRNPESLRRAFVLREVLGTPVGLR